MFVQRSRVAAHRDALLCRQAEPRNVVRMQQDHVSAILAAVDIFFLVDDRVELAFAADRHQPQLPIVPFEIRQLMAVQGGFAADGVGKRGA